MSNEPESPEVQLLSFSFSQQLLPSTAGHSNATGPGAMYPPLYPDLADQNEMDFSHAQDFQHFSSMVDFSFDHDACASNGTQSCAPDDASSVGHSSHTDDSQLISGNEAWNSLTVDTANLHGSALDQLSSTMFHPVPVSPPLTEASNDVSVTSSCSNSGFPSFPGQDENFFGDITHPTLGGQSINLAEPFFPLTPPLSDQDPNRTIRPSKQAQRPLLSAATSRNQRKSDPEYYASLPVRESIRQRSRDNSEQRSPRDHPYYSLPTRSDGKYYCPFATGEKPCNHPPTTQKCAYHKYLDSHLKPYRCKVPACMDAQLHFSSNACLFRHEREAHGFHGHGDNPHLCLFEGCDRSVPGNGFPRRWNLYDHMKRVHDYAGSERPSSPEASSAASGQSSKKKDNTGRKRKVGTSGAQPMKRSRSNQAQTNPLKIAQVSAHHGQRLQNAERNYYNCRSRLLEELSNINPKDAAMHDKVNASLQELITLGLNYRRIEASQAAAQMASGLSA
ncbi:hypothetical protein VTN00DRAFT_8200 [Thermoascus crustaceus]|uniref:uncharacterized protein n=1 Tax=Thermoascus crustaceus TaxID=5088 RepID=UPI00374271F2